MYNLPFVAGKIAVIPILILIICPSADSMKSRTKRCDLKIVFLCNIAAVDGQLTRGRLEWGRDH